MITEIIISLFVSYLILFLLSIKLKDNSIVDVFWPLGFLQVGFLSLFLSKSFTISQILLFSIILLWSLRLSSYILFKKLKKKGEDPRYQKWRNQWKYFYTRSFFQVYLLQMVLLLIVSIPIIIFNLNVVEISSLMILGSLLSLYGLFYESIGDFQLYKFINDKKNKGKLMTTGLWKYSRHPNYFGESCFWFGIGVMTFQASIFGFTGFIVITILLRFVSGVPMAESNYKGNLEFEKYAKKTPPMFPNFFVK